MLNIIIRPITTFMVDLWCRCQNLESRKCELCRKSHHLYQLAQHHLHIKHIRLYSIERWNIKNKGYDVAIGSTITKGNVWQIDELLDFMLENNIYGRFRVAEFINRLYNNKLTDTIRNFTDIERYHLACFFTRVLNSGLETDFNHSILERTLML